jgi:hypothetical protein
VAAHPSVTISTGSYNFCRFAALRAAPLAEQAAAAVPDGSAAADAAADAALRGDDAAGAAAAAADAFLCAPDDAAAAPPAASGADADADASEPGAASPPCLSALVALAGTDPAALELWDLAAGARLAQLCAALPSH